MSEEEVITSPREDLEWQIRLQSDEIERLNNIIKEAIDYVEHISNVDIDWHEQDRIINILRRCDNE